MNFDGYDLCFGGSVPVVSLVPVVPFRWFRWFRWFRSGGYAGSGGSVPVVSFRCSGFYHMPNILMSGYGNKCQNACRGKLNKRLIKLADQ